MPHPSSLASKEAIRTRLQALPETPGCYLMKDEHGEIIYVGKAKVLRNRVRSYFQNKHVDAKTMQLVARIRDFDYIVTDTEHEALVLEATLVKRYRPKYNVMLKDDKALPFIKVTVHEEYPRVVKVRQLVDDGSRYFGPYSVGGSAARTIALVEKFFPLCYREEPIEGTQKKACLQYYIHRCLGACAGKASPEEYRAAVQQVLLFLEGKHEQVVEKLEVALHGAAERLDFERAAYYRDRLRDLQSVMARQKVVLPDPIDMDVVALAIEQDEACAEVLFVRQGKLLGHEHYVMHHAEGERPEAVLQSFVELFYSNAASVPELLLLQHSLIDPDPTRAMLRERRGAAVTIQVPQRGEKKGLIELAAKNAREGLEAERFKWLSDEQKRTGALVELQHALGLAQKPGRIECFDVSNSQGTNIVASMVVFEDGKPARGAYRRFQIKTVEDGPNDFESMREALTRRFKRATQPSEEDGAKWTRLPDLLVVDGGKGQLGVALEVLQAVGLPQQQVVGLAKQHEEIFLPGRSASLLLPRNSEALYLMQRIRDEAHRFAVTYHRNLRSKAAIKSPLDGVRGVGPKKKKALIQAFGSVKGLRNASVEQIAEVKGIDLAIAQRVKAAI